MSEISAYDLAREARLFLISLESGGIMKLITRKKVLDTAYERNQQATRPLYTIPEVDVIAYDRSTSNLESVDISTHVRSASSLLLRIYYIDNGYCSANSRLSLEWWHFNEERLEYAIFLVNLAVEKSLGVDVDILSPHLDRRELLAAAGYAEKKRRSVRAHRKERLGEGVPFP